ncbi:MAG: alpha/beta fold hydrolase [Promethearchaeota archaeon]
MTGDILKLMDNLSIKKANFFGYSIGAYMTFQLLLQKPELFISAILGGFVLYTPQNEKERALYRESNLSRIQAFKVENIDQVKDPISRRFRQFAELGGNDLDALAAVMTANFQETPEWLGSPNEVKKLLKKVKVPVMTVVGSDEFIPGDKTLIAQLIPNACHFQIQGKDHLTVVPDPKFHMAVKAFLNYVNKT